MRRRSIASGSGWTERSPLHCSRNMEGCFGEIDTSPAFDTGDLRERPVQLVRDLRLR